jgi:hypothetical protein
MFEYGTQELWNEPSPPIQLNHEKTFFGSPWSAVARHRFSTVWLDAPRSGGGPSSRLVQGGVEPPHSKTNASQVLSSTLSVREPSAILAHSDCNYEREAIASETQAARKGATKDENLTGIESLRFEIRLRPVTGPGCL